MNGIYGIFISIWATAFIESWKRKQKTIQYIWGCSDKANTTLDERDDEFKFFNQFNGKTMKKEKIKEEMDPFLKYT